ARSPHCSCDRPFFHAVLDVRKFARGRFSLCCRSAYSGGVLMMNKKLWFSALSLILVHVAVVGAAFIAPYDPAEQHRDVPFAPPTRVHFVDAQGKFHVRPHVCSWINQTQGVGPARYVEDCSRTASLRFLVRSDLDRAPAGSRAAWHLFGTNESVRVFLFGTDDYGRDQLSRLLYGGQVSLFAGLVAPGLSLGLGLLIGAMAGYLGSWMDDAMMRAAEVFMALPWIYLLFAVRAFLPLHVGPRQSFFLVVGVIGLTGWARP